jgi:hypothetical protein
MEVEERMLARWGSLPPDVLGSQAPPLLPIADGSKLTDKGPQWRQARRCVDLFLTAASLPEVHAWVFASRGPHACLSFLGDDDDGAAASAAERAPPAKEKLALFNWLAPALLWTLDESLSPFVTRELTFELDTLIGMQQVARRVRQAWRALHRDEATALVRGGLESVTAVLIEALSIFKRTYIHPRTDARVVPARAWQSLLRAVVGCCLQ